MIDFKMENNLNKIYILLFLTTICGGCAKISHLDQLLTLKGLADEQVQMGKQIDEQDQKFEMMLEEVKAGTLNQYLNKKLIVQEFGEPIYIKSVNKNEQQMEVWLYRYAAEFFGAEKIYLYFDSDENLINSEYMERPNGEIR